MCINKIDGLLYSTEIRDKLSKIIEQFNIHPNIAIVMVGENKASEIYVNNKIKTAKSLGIATILIKLKQNVKEAQLLNVIDYLNKDDVKAIITDMMQQDRKNSVYSLIRISNKQIANDDIEFTGNETETKEKIKSELFASKQQIPIHGIILQLPLPEHINKENVLSIISPEKDLDGLNPLNVGFLHSSRNVPYTITEIFEMFNCIGRLFNIIKNDKKVKDVGSELLNDCLVGDAVNTERQNGDIFLKFLENLFSCEFEEKTINHNDKLFLSNKIKKTMYKILNFGCKIPFIPCTPLGCLYLIEKTLQTRSEDLIGKNVVIFGNSNLVSKPMARLLLQSGASVTTLHSKSKNYKCILKNADIVVSATGCKQDITYKDIKSDAIIIDIGIRTDLNNRITGDLDFQILSKTNLITPVPKGVGPMTVTALMLNSVLACIKVKLLLYYNIIANNQCL